LVSPVLEVKLVILELVAHVVQTVNEDLMVSKVRKVLVEFRVFQVLTDNLVFLV
jgi:hypothetical protein